MAEINQRDRSVRVKIVYYGPPLGGKTTNLQVLHRHASPDRRGDLISLNSMQDRTILFDLLPIKTVGPRGFELRLQLLTVPGQAQYAATRRAALRGVDGVVFVANSAADRWQENLDSYQEMVRHLAAHQIDPTSIPLVVQHNKRDLPSVTPIGTMDRALNARGEGSFAAVAPRGEGVIETFRAILARTLADLSRRYRTLEMRDGQAEQWARQAALGVFGREGVAVEPEPALETLIERRGGGEFGIPAEFEAVPLVEPSDAPTSPPPSAAPRAMRVATPETTSPAAASSAGRDPVAIGKAYAEACAELANWLTDANSQRDEARKRLGEIQRAVGIAREAEPADLDGHLRRVLSCLAESAAAAHASFALWSEGEEAAPRTVVLPPLPADPLLESASGVAYLLRTIRASAPHLEEAADNLDLRALLAIARCDFSALALVPVRTARRPLGLALLYFDETDLLPNEEALEQLGVLASVFAAPLELACRQKTCRSSAPVPVADLSPSS